MEETGERRPLHLDWHSFNACGLSDDELFEAVEGLHERGVYGAVVTETHRAGRKVDELGGLPRGWTFLGHGCDRGAREKQGVGFLLSPRAQRDWAAAGRRVVFASARTMAIRLAYGLSTMLVIASYFPHSGYPDADVEAHYDELDLVLSKRRAAEDFMIGADTNSDVGYCVDRTSDRARAVGPFGVRHWTARGDRLAAWALLNRSVVARTFFQKDPRHLATYHDFKTGLAHSNDQFIVSHGLFRKVLDAGRALPLIRSDHTPIKIRIRLPRRCSRFGRAPHSAASTSKRRPRFDYQIVAQAMGLAADARREEFHASFAEYLIEEHAKYGIMLRTYDPVDDTGGDAGGGVGGVGDVDEVEGADDAHGGGAGSGEVEDTDDGAGDGEDEVTDGEHDGGTGGIEVEDTDGARGEEGDAVQETLPTRAATSAASCTDADDDDAATAARARAEQASSRAARAKARAVARTARDEAADVADARGVTGTSGDDDTIDATGGGGADGAAREGTARAANETVGAAVDVAAKDAAGDDADGGDGGDADGAARAGFVVPWAARTRAATRAAAAAAAGAVLGVVTGAIGAGAVLDGSADGGAVAASGSGDDGMVQESRTARAVRDEVGADEYGDARAATDDDGVDVAESAHAADDCADCGDADDGGGECESGDTDVDEHGGGKNDDTDDDDGGEARYEKIVAFLEEAADTAEEQAERAVDAAQAASGIRYKAFVAALEKAVEKCIPLKGKRKPGWFTASVDVIMAASSKRNVLQARFSALRPGTEQEAVRALLRDARKAVFRTVNDAKNAWIKERCGMLNGDSDNCGGAATFWAAAKELMEGLQKPHAPRPLVLRKADGELATSDAENLAVLAKHYAKLYNRSSSFDPRVLDKLPARAIIDAMDELPSDQAIRDALKKLKPGKSGGNGLPSDAFKLVTQDATGFEELKAFLADFWDSGMAPAAWVTLQLAVLKKKGDPSDVSNTRGIALMEAVPKLVGVLIATILNVNVVLVGDDFCYQSGFIPKRGCPDGQVPLKLALAARHRCDLDSHVVFVDLVKAFDSVDRIALDGVLEKMGVPAKLRGLIKALHSDVKVEIKMGDEKVSFSNSMGVVQGGTLSPTLFIIFVHAFVATLEVTWAQPSYYTQEDDVISGRSMFVKGGERFDYSLGFYADDGSFVFCNRADVNTGTAAIREHFGRWGLEMHVGRGDKEAKTVALYCPGHTRSYDDGDTSRIVFADGTFVHYVKWFKHLGSFVDYTLRDDFDIDKRIEAASKMFGFLRTCIFGRLQVSYEAKRAAFVAIIVPTLLYGCETWSISSVGYGKLRSFFNRCVRTMCHVNMWHTREFHITTAALLERLHLRTFDVYVNRRVVRWLGHVARMSFDRLPRKFLTAWVKGPRGSGVRRLNYGTHAKHCLDKCLSPADRPNWYEIAQDRERWRLIVDDIDF
jgi:hypothetical protein